MRYAVVLLLLLVACEDRYRYYCQDPSNFNKPQCQKPACEFSQTCPEYLVAPILGVKIEGNTTQAPVQQQCTTNCR